MMLQAAVLSVLFCSVHSFTIQDPFEKSGEHSGNTVEDDEFSVSTLLENANINVGNNTVEDDEFSVSTLLEKANVDVGKNFDEPLVMFGDIAVPTGLQNADPCTARGCMWPKAKNGRVYIPFRISRAYKRKEKRIIKRGLRSFASCTCIRFIPLKRQKDFVDIKSLSGCYSFVGRRGGGQVVSLKRSGCLYRKIIQHEMLHALGFDHEQTRSDRNKHVRICLQNVIRGKEHNFRKIKTRNLGTPYDYNSVMEYGRFAFSRNKKATIVPIPNRNVRIGKATKMSRIDILRVNRLYGCKMAAPGPT